jgi:hypothetical protein
MRLPLVVLAAWALASCGSYEMSKMETPRPEPAGKAFVLPQSDRDEELAASKTSAEAPDEPAPAAADSSGAGKDDTQAAVPQPKEKRARIYSGFCRLVVDEIEQAKKELENLATGSGGYVEAVNGSVVTLRVPAARFMEVFAAVQKLGEVAHKAIETYDVSDTLRDQETRLRLAERARERLYQLLERSSDVKERLAILREIKRLTEEIEQVRLSLELLKNQIAYSRITVELIPRQPQGEQRRAGIPFPWIAALNPLYPSLSRSAGKAVPVLSDDFAVFRKEASFRAESPEGTRVRLGGTRNTPRGAEAFWQKALLFHLGPQYRKAEPLESGAFRGVLFTSKDSKPYAYLVAVRMWKRKLIVLEAFFPDDEALAKRLDTVKAALAGLAIQ